MKNKSTHHKDDNTFQFQSFAERISNIDINIFHRVPHEYEVTDDIVECNFYQCIQKWNLLCLTQEYQNFHKHVTGIITLPQLLHRKQQVVDELVKYIKLQDVLSLQAFLELLVAFAKDLQKDFYQFYPQFFDILISLLNIKETDQIEWSFTTLAHLFKLMWRCLVKDIQDVFKSLLPLLSDNQPEYVRNFACESFAFVARKIKDRKKFLSLIIQSIQDSDDGIAGCGKLLFEVMNGVDGNFHSCTESFLTFLLEALSDSDIVQNVLFAILQEIFQNICRKIKPQHNNAFWKCVFQILDKHKLAFTQDNSINYLTLDLRLIGITVEYKQGKFLTSHKSVLINKVEIILNLDNLSEDDLLNISKLCIMLLKLQHIHLTQEESVLISSKLLSVPFKSVLLDFVERLIDYSSFEVHILPHFLKECVKNNFQKEYLSLFCKILHTKVPFAGNGINLCNWRVYYLPFNSSEDRKVCMKTLSENLDENSDLESYIQSLICLPHVASKNENILVVLNERLLTLCNQISSKANERDIMILGYVIECLIHLSAEKDQLEVHFETILNSLLPLCSNKNSIRSLKILDMYLTCISNFNSNLKSMETLEKLNAVLNDHFSSPYHEIRLLTTHIYSLFEDLWTSDDLKVFSFCYTVESMPSSVETYRDQLQILQKLAWDSNYVSLLRDTEFEMLPLKYLIGVLYVNFKLLWDPMSNLIASYAHGMPIATFWPIFFSKLKNATLNKPQEVIEHEDETGTLASVLEKEMGLVDSSQDDKPDFQNFRFYLWKTVALFPDLAEMKTRDVSELFLQFYQNEFKSENPESTLTCNIKTNDIVEAEEESEDTTQKKSKIRVKNKAGGGSKNNIAVLIQCLSVYGKVKSPVSMYRESELYQIYLGLLSHKNWQIQKFALDCLMPYKHKYLNPYREHLYNLIDEKNFKNQLSLFRVDTESNVVQDEHRDDLMPLIMRIVFAKMTAKTGMRTGGKTSGQMRRNLVFRFLAGCREQEMIYFINMSFRSYDSLIKTLPENPEELCATIFKTANLEEFPSLKRLQSSANLLSVIFQQFGGLMSDTLLRMLLKILFVIACHVTKALQQDSNVYVGFVSNLRNVKSTCIKVLEKFYNKFEEYAWSPEEVNAVFKVFVWPNLGKICVDNVTSPSALLKLFNQWGQNPKYFHLLVKPVDETEDSDFILKHILKLLHGDKTHISVINVVIEIIERLLSLQNEKEAELQSSKELNFGTKLLIPHVSTILEFFKNKLARKKNFTPRELFILSRISELVLDPDMSDKILSLLLPILLKKYQTNTTSETVLDAVTTIANLIKVNRDPLRHIKALCPMFGLVGSVSARKVLCQILTNVSESFPDFTTSATIVSKMNAWDAKWVEQADFQERLNAFKQVAELGDGIDVDLGLLVIHNCWYNIQNERDLSLRENSAHCLQVVGPILCRKYQKSNEMDLIVNQTLLTLIRSGIKSKSNEVKNESIGLLGHLARECPETYYVLEDLNRFTNKVDLEVDFFENLKHLQLHRRTRALLKFSQIAGSALENNQKPLHCRTLTQFILPLTSQYLCSPYYANKNSIIDAAIETMCTICRLLPWHQYELLLRYYLNKLRRKSEFQRQLVRLLVGILDSFHFDLSNGIEAEAKNETVFTTVVEKKQTSTVAEKEPEDGDTTKELNDLDEVLEEQLLNDDVEIDLDPSKGKNILSKSAATRVIATIKNVLLPQLYRTLGEMTHHESSHKVNRKQLGSEREEEELVKVPISLALIKLLQRLPKKILDTHLSGIFMKLCSFLKSPLESVRRTARETLEKVMLSLGPEYLNCLLGEMVTLLSRGFQVHVLSYTMYSVLNSLKNLYKPGHVDSCLLTVLEICTRDLFGAIAEEKQVSKIVTKVSEAKSKKSFDVFQLLAQFITEACLMDLLAPLKNVLTTTPSFKVINTVDECLRFTVLGLADNQFVSSESLMTFAFGLASQAILSDLEGKKSSKKEKSQLKELKSDCFIIPKAPGRARCAKTNAKVNLHVLVEFGVRLCYFMLKREKVRDGSFLDPFVKIFAECLRSNHVKLCTLALQCLSWCFKFDLPTLRAEIATINKLMFDILHKYASSTGENAEIVVATFKTMAVLVRDASYHTLEEDSLKILVLYIEQDLHTHEKQATAFTLLKAILSRKFSVKELYELMTKVEELSVTSELTHIRSQCRQISLQFLLDYPHGKKLDNHVNFYISQLEYEVQSGRESTLEMLTSLVRGFPLKVLQKMYGVLMIPLAVRLVNDESPECRKMVANCLSSLFERLPHSDVDTLFEIIIGWFNETNLNHRRLAAQLTGILVTVEKERFEQRLPSFKDVLLRQFSIYDDGIPGRFVRLEHRSKISAEESSQEKERLKDHQLFQALQMLLKIVNHCPNFFTKVCDATLSLLASHVQTLLAYPHDWVRLGACQYLGLALANIDADKVAAKLDAWYRSIEDDCKGFLFDGPHDSIKRLTLDLCAQLTTNDVKQDLVEQAIKNLVAIARILCKVPIDFVGDGDPQRLHLLWLIKRMRKVVNAEVVDNAEKITLRMGVFKWIAAVCTIANDDMLKSVLYHLMSPLVREMISTEEENAPLRQLSKEVAGMLKKKVGMEAYTKALMDVEQKINVKRAVRKRTKSQLAVTDPELFAQKKMKQQEKKKLSKKRKIQRGKGLLVDNRKSKKRRVDD